jgi:hypothetical protein
VYATFGVTPTMNDDWSSGPTGKESFGRAPTPCTVASQRYSAEAHPFRGGRKRVRSEQQTTDDGRADSPVVAQNT